MSRTLPLLLVLVLAVLNTGTLAVAQSDWGAEEDEDHTLDFNGDGEPDLFYEYSDYSYLQLMDRNFDGEVDESYQFDNTTDLLIGGRLDNDFDGDFETQVVVQDGMPVSELVDTNGDRLIDIVHTYKHGVIVTSRRFETAASGDTSRLTTVQYQHGFPVSSETVDTEQSAEAFHEDALRNVKYQHLGGIRT